MSSLEVVIGIMRIVAVAEEVVGQVLDKSVPVLESVWSIVISMAVISVVPM